jgi:hypothetical protein
MSLIDEQEEFGDHSPSCECYRCRFERNEVIECEVVDGVELLPESFWGEDPPRPEEC